jgi:beta-ureidopropionase / N-carbamoyl-L-amino-acid hydrolase
MTRQVILVDADRLRADFEALSAIGDTGDGGVRRTSFSDTHLEARAWFLARAQAAGLETRIDPAGNHSVVLPGSSADCRTLLLGSHLDTVPTGGRYDGALGVLAALETLRAVKDAGLELPVGLEAIDFTDEEGAVVGLLGSWALTGALTQEILGSPRGGREALTAGLARSGLSEQTLVDARRNPVMLAGYLELHIEQGPVLERENVEIGIVTAIAGSRSYRLVFEGARRHAGTTPMNARSDALLAAAAFALSVRDTVSSEFPRCVGTVGAIEVERPAFNVIAGRVHVMLELRAPDAEQLDALEAAVLAAARREATPAGVQIHTVGSWEPVALDPRIQQVMTDAAQGLDLSTLRLASGAGHDAQALAAITPTGMIFVPSVGGTSHDPAEATHWRDCVNGANVLLRTAVAIAQSGRR